jgi:hypothetical protein
MEKQRLRVFVNKLLTGMSGSKTERQMAEGISGGGDNNNYKICNLQITVTVHLAQG